ncbi:MAG: POTRA domain-containing protein [Myxococcales bacterium]|nr:BamA/TamA family outer membrane protein [Myxococcales bacterium]
MLLAILLCVVEPLWSAQPAQVGEIVFEGAPAESVRSLVGVQVGAPLDARDVRDAVRALHGSARFSRVAAYVEALPDGRVRLVFVLTGVQKLIAVSFPGHQALAESILHQTANLQVNAEFQPEQVAPAVEALRAAYFRIGYRRAEITPMRRTTPAGVALDFQIKEGQATRIAEVRFEGETGLENEELAAAFKLAQGDVLNMSLLDDGVRGVRDRYRKAGRLRARVDAPQVEEVSPAKARVVVPVEAGPLVRFHIRGNRAFNDAVLATKLAADSDEPLDAQAAQEMAGRLRRFYVSAGFLRVKVAEREMVARDGAEEIVFSVDEGRQVRVEKVVITGVNGIAESSLRERLMLILREGIPRDPAAGADPGLVERMGVMGTLPDPHAVRTKVDPETVFDPVLYARALKQFEDLYKSQGYLSARAGPPRLDAIEGDQNRLTVTIPIHEGEQTKVSRIVVEGGADVPARELDAAIVLRAGQPFSYLQAEEGRAALTSIFTRRGHLYARVEDEETFEDVAEGGAEARVEVRYRIQPGPVVKVGYVEVVGQRRTIEGLVLDLVGLRRGDVLTPDVMDRGQQALLRTGLFFSATLTPRNPEVAESEKTVQVQLRERPTRDFQASLGFSLADGPRASAQWTQGNLLGRNLTFTAVGRADFPFGRFPTVLVDPDCQEKLIAPCDRRIAYPDDPIERVVDLGLSAPRLWPLTDSLRAGIDLIHQRALQPTYQLKKYSSQLSIELTQRRPFFAGVAYEFGYQNLGFLGQQSLEEQIGRVDVAIHRAPEGTMIFGSLRPNMFLDLRDDPARPRSGLLLQVGGDFLKSFSGSETTEGGIHVNLLKVQGLVAGYVPLPFLSSIVLSARGGRIIQLDNRSKDPLDRRFYLGGASTLRGFHEEAIQPQDLINGFHDQVRACNATLGDVACTRAVQLLEAGATSDGGDQFIALTAELRVPFTQNFEMALFYDAGNLWLNPTNLLGRDAAGGRNLVLRDAVGAGLRWLTPIGRMAIDIGVNLQPDALLGEPQWGPYFSIDPL